MENTNTERDAAFAPNFPGDHLVRIALTVEAIERGGDPDKPGTTITRRVSVGGVPTGSLSSVTRIWSQGLAEQIAEMLTEGGE